ncbi:enoyl-CoA hydratase/isomerase family protein [Rhodococcus fascians]|nr:enoyl-CoA hydratase/isomerase family protein [Rhodococcus fascians]MBY3998474.1 enoyl-CoA hydratase/isomerase family protein [Rhodococcus fascians]MBY4004531.1 enoyl-CoA hydratase/isomerase family protein [Rhodococcus fascians]MBY4009287.1 enoyl-CoA hydratase/isomerase family protein [Rhodococcus fascians]MBY4019738.1 enoyl-CoA hydratase/isomerase family protein [Rhodococcus fascians]
MIYTELVGHTLVIRINRADKYNAFTQDMYASTAKILRDSSVDPAVRSIVITGTGKAFSAGNDLGDFDLAADGNTPVQHFLRAIADVEVPVVAAVNGLAVGVGVTMLLHCELVFAAPTATFQVPFVDVGLVPEAASSLLLPQLIGARRAAEMFLTGRKLEAEEARSWGLVNHVVADPFGRAFDVAEAIASKAPTAVRSTKALLRSTISDVTDRMQEEELLLVAQLESSEFTEAMAARREKRIPQF